MPEEPSIEGTAGVSLPLQSPYSIRIERGQRGTYGWEITDRGANKQQVLADLDAIDLQLRGTYLQTEGA